MILAKSSVQPALLAGGQYVSEALTTSCGGYLRVRVAMLKSRVSLREAVVARIAKGDDFQKMNKGLEDLEKLDMWRAEIPQESKEQANPFLDPNKAKSNRL